MTGFVADENFHGTIILAVHRHAPHVDILTVQDVGITSIGDPELIEFATGEKRLLLTHDVNTMIGFFKERVERGMYRLRRASA